MIRESMERLANIFGCSVFTLTLIVLLLSLVGIVQWK